MKKYLRIVLPVLVLALLFSPVHAFTADSLDIHVQPDGGARITFDYTLNWIEYAAVFTRIADPATELRQAIGNNFNSQVTIAGVTDRETQLDVQRFASVQQAADGTTTYTTPAISFASAEKVLKQVLVCTADKPGPLASGHAGHVPGRVCRPVR